MAKVIQFSSTGTRLVLRNDLGEGRHLRIRLVVSSSADCVTQLTEVFASLHRGCPADDGECHNLIELFLLYALVEVMGGRTGAEVVAETETHVWIDLPQAE